MPSTSGSRRWLGYALVTTFAWGLWGAFSDLPAKHGFPDTLTYVVWSATMLLAAAFVVYREGWKVRSTALGLAIGLSGAGGVSSSSQPFRSARPTSSFRSFRLRRQLRSPFRGCFCESARDGLE